MPDPSPVEVRHDDRDWYLATLLQLRDGHGNS
jgi:hypothetical protein